MMGVSASSVALRGRALRVIRKWARSPFRGHVAVTFVEASVGQVILGIPEAIPHEVAMRVERQLRGRPHVPRPGPGPESLGYGGREHPRCGLPQPARWG